MVYLVFEDADVFSSCIGHVWTDAAMSDVSKWDI